MEKYISLGSDAPGWGQSHRLIHPETMEKLAEECYTPPHLVEVMKTLKPRPEGRYILLNAIGACEYTGATRNGDAFPEWSLKSERAPEAIQALYKANDPNWVHPNPDDYGYKSFPTNAHVYVSHANKDPQKAIGDVIASAYNDVMHRVELIVFVYRDRAEDVVDRIDNDIQVPFSMGARLKKDRCCVPTCSNLAKTRMDYCDHLAHSLNATLPDGTKIFSYNDFPKFFDISAVRVPADRSAWSLKKVAHVAELPAPPTKLAAFSKLSDIIKKVPVESSTSLGSTPIDPKLVAFSRKSSKQHINKDVAIDPSLVEVTKREGLKRVIPALTSLGVIIKPKHLLTLSNRDESQVPAKYAESDVDIRIVRALTKVAERQTLLDPLFTQNYVRDMDAPISITGSDSAVFRKYASYLKGIDFEVFTQNLKNNPSIDFMLGDNCWFEKNAGAGKDTPSWLPFIAGISTL